MQSCGTGSPAQPGSRAPLRVGWAGSCGLPATGPPVLGMEAGRLTRVAREGGWAARRSGGGTTAERWSIGAWEQTVDGGRRYE
jgi:hypothetical protein